MAVDTKANNKDELNAGFESIINHLEVACDKIKFLKDNQELHKEIQLIITSLLDEKQNIDFVTKMLSLQESVKNEKSFYFNKTGTSLNNLPEITQLESVANILLETGVGDYNSNSVFSKYMSMIEKCAKEKEFIDNIDKCINKLEVATEQQNDLKCELSHLIYTPEGYTAEPVPAKSIENVQIDDNCTKIVELIKKIDDIEKKQVDICQAISALELEQKTVYHGLPPSIEKATMAVQLAEKNMKALSKQLIENL